MKLLQLLFGVVAVAVALPQPEPRLVSNILTKKSNITTDYLPARLNHEVCLSPGDHRKSKESV